MIALEQLLNVLGVGFEGFEQARREYMAHAKKIAESHQGSAINKFQHKKMLEVGRAKQREYGSRLLAVRGDSDHEPRRKKPKGGAIHVPRAFSSVFR